MIVKNDDEMKELAWEFGRNLRGGEVVELRGDVGVGKTTFTQGLARGLGVTAAVSSPSFTIMKSYLGRGGLTLNHYDFYRLDDAGIMKKEIAESLADERNVTVVEWAKDVAGVLPAERFVVEIRYVSDEVDSREVIYDTGY
ncbi:MAG: tRNA (adenosine(37)-N6)-threonylcarbamoyltransferase complex ATPase subunit type 1 TsaE [Candidatus Nomurabacteria bacterium]|jgi:tRNA threonylcarbamoyladenosine biosynthesis protein TsaE|nr:tRNA (adenosine(37)-N6)-threonylcarbamoyltransferase complex ATPase subunit type 1 TsaE [Candidatus Nomurabacteria bacterium]